MAKPKPTKMLAVLGRSRRTGRWRLASRSSVLSVLGSCYLDMTNSFVDDKEKLKMTVTVFLGSATFILPDGAEVRPSGTAVIAAAMVDVPDHDETSDLPTLDIEWTCLFGRIRILSEDAAGKLNAEQRQKRLEKAIKKGKAVPLAEADFSTAAMTAPGKPAGSIPDQTPSVVGVGFDEPVGDEVPVVGVGFDEPVGDEVPVVGVGFDEPVGDEVPVVGVGFDEPVEDEVPVVGVGFDEPVGDEVPVVGVGFDEPVEDEVPVGGVGFDEPVEDEAPEQQEGLSKADSGESTEDGPETAIADDVASQDYSDRGFIDIEYDKTHADATV